MNSPDSGSVRLKWKRFVSIHRKDFNTVGKFAVWSEHFTGDCFTLAFPKDMKRSLKKGTFPTIWKKSSQTLSKRSRRSVSEITMYLRCAYHHYIILFPHLPVTWFFSGIVVQYSCNECSDYLDFAYCCMCFHTFLLSSLSYSKTGISPEWTWSQFPNSQTL